MFQTESFDKLKTFIDSYVDQSNQGRVVVLPIRCGLGKSTYIRHRISDTLHNGDSGLIVITDAIDRMTGYISTDDTLGQYIQRNQNKIALLTSQTIVDELKTQWRKPILIMTTQRYFNLTKSEIVAFTKYSGGSRDKIIFDEKPYLIEHRQFDIKSFNDIDSALHLTLDDSVDSEEKAWAIKQWELFRQKIQTVISEYERQNPSQLEVWYSEENATVTEDDNRFFAFIDKYRQKLNQFRPQMYSSIYAVRQLVSEGATFISQKIRSGNEYRNYFLVTLDHSDLLLDIGADVYVLDATSDIDPIYNQYYIKMIDCRKFTVRLDNLTINIVDVPTNKNQICKSSVNHSTIISCIREYLLADPQTPGVIFTYKEIKDCFDSHFEHVHYFGAIKGLNQFRDYVSIAQIGLNRFPDPIYRQIGYFTKLNECDYGEKRVIRFIKDKSIKNIMNHALLVDVEQNLFRSKIRNIDCTDPVVYTIFCNCNSYSDLISLIKERYEPLGATVNIIQTPTQLKMQKSLNRNTSTKTNVQTFLEWYNHQPKGRLFKRSDVLQECNFTAEQFKNLKKSPVIKQIFGESKTDIPTIYIVRIN